MAKHMRHEHAESAHAEFCPRCHCTACFRKAPFDGAWVCQRCLRTRIYETSGQQAPRTETRQLTHA